MNNKLAIEDECEKAASNICPMYLEYMYIHIETLLQFEWIFCGLIILKTL